MTNTDASYAAKLLAAGFISGGLFFGGLIGMGTAHADPDPWVGSDEQAHDAALVCRWLDTDPTEHGMVVAVKRLLGQGLTTKITGDTVGLAVDHICPEYRPLFDQTYRDIMPSGTAALAAI